MLRRLFGPRPGSRYFGPVAYCDDYSLVGRPGYYALTSDGKAVRKPLLRLVYVDDAPGDPDDPSGHYEVAGPKDPVQRPGRIVALRADLEGSAGVL